MFHRVIIFVLVQHSLDFSRVGTLHSSGVRPRLSQVLKIGIPNGRSCHHGN